jgi:cell division protein FtsB
MARKSREARWGNIGAVIAGAALSGSLVWWGWYLWTSKAGMREYNLLARELEECKRSLTRLEKQLAKARAELACFEQEPSYKERIARQDLQLIHPSETFYKTS